MARKYKKLPRKGKHHQIRYESTDFHHFLFQRKHYQQGYAKALREHWYTGAYISIMLHRDLHSKIHDVPTPNGEDCKHAFLELCRREHLGLIYPEDPPWERLNFLIEMFEEKCPATTAILEWQKQVILKFYRR